ncbi:Crp/Fnr family transcriptional regulator [Mucilaginibacter lacusdianchii]|uniref:Crp/Fnr family transcriptional regulator n=1 Tax=Mucilaginibacter lacusdianchii TaxID=2684211 RepID=UPI00131BB8F6|nr:Crp/Fnr family transcriptional regulator [Mucilaginibacter sp. JXJ CY 39]
MKESKRCCDLKSCFLCKTCLPEWIPAVGSQRKNYIVKKGETIFNEGDQVTGIYFMFNGLAKVHKKWGPDKELIIRFAQNGNIIGHRGLGGDARYPVSATALENSIVCYIDLPFFLASLKVNNELTYQLLLFFAEELQTSEHKMRNLAHMTVKGRIAQALLNLSNQFGTDTNGCVGINLSRQDLAAYVGATYESVFRNMNELIQDKLITVNGKNISVHNHSLLEALTRENYTSL